MSVDLDFITTRPMPFKALDKKTDYISREAAIERIEKLFQLQKATARTIIEAIPAADVRPVVLCRDCKYGQGAKMDFWNEYEGIECIGGVVHRKDWFCADGEKREES